MLCLKCETNSEWIEAVKNDLNITIIDHAHCEKKAAQTGMKLLNAHPEKTDVGLQMTDLIEEEIGHYRSVLKILQRKGITLSPDKGDEYARKLFSQVRKQSEEKFLDHLLVAGIIEARSCERLQILGKHIEDEELKRFYTTLAESEAGHYVTFVKIAKTYFDEADVKQRLDELTDFEAELVKNLPNEPTMHG
jgi:tRNA-(ms[2]io[6]A)-hydroxylase